MGGSCNTAEDYSDTTSMASWLHVATTSECFKEKRQSESASVASSWMDVGDLADFEAEHEKTGTIDISSTSTCHEVAAQPSKCEVHVGSTTWSSLVSKKNNTENIHTLIRPRVPMPPLTRCQAPRKKPAPVEDEEFEDDQDGRGRGRASRKHRQRR